MSTARQLITKFIWVTGYNAFVMGGSTNYIFGAELKALPVSLGKGFKGLVVTSPNGTVRVAEFETGAIVGDSVEQVKQDIREGDKALMLNQVKAAQQQLDTWRKVIAKSPEEFWGRVEK